MFASAETISLQRLCFRSLTHAISVFPNTTVFGQETQSPTTFVAAPTTVRRDLILFTRPGNLQAVWGLF
jgi:hypothetical protein